MSTNINQSNEANLAQNQNLLKGAAIRSNEPAALNNRDQDMTNIPGVTKIRDANDVKEGYQSQFQQLSTAGLNTNVNPNIKEQQLPSQMEQPDQKKGGPQGGQMLNNLNAGQRKLQQQILDQKKDAVYWEQKHKELMNEPRDLHHQQHILQKQQEEIQRLQRLRESGVDTTGGDFVEQREALTTEGVRDQGAKHYLDRPVQDALNQQDQQQDSRFIDQQHRQQIGQDFVKGIPKDNLNQDQLRGLNQFNPISQTGQTEDWQTEKHSFQHRKDLTQEERNAGLQKNQQQQQQQQQDFGNQQFQDQQRSGMRQEDRGTQEYTSGQQEGQYLGKDQSLGQNQQQKGNIQWPSSSQLKQEFGAPQTTGDINKGVDYDKLKQTNQSQQTGQQLDNQNWGYNRQV